MHIPETFNLKTNPTDDEFNACRVQIVDCLARFMGVSSAGLNKTIKDELDTKSDEHLQMLEDEWNVQFV